MKKFDNSGRFGLLVNELGRLLGRRFDQISRAEHGLSRAQCRVIAQIASDEGDLACTQAELAHRLDLTPMGLGTLCDRMEAAGLIMRRPSPIDGRANLIELQPQARYALEKALKVGDVVQVTALTGFSSAECEQFLSMMQRVRANLHPIPAEPATD